MSAPVRAPAHSTQGLIALGISLLLTVAGALTALSTTAYAASTATVTGQVLTSVGSPALDVEVTLLQRDRVGDPVQDYRAVAWAHTDADGRYTFSPAPGTYAVLAQPWDEAQGVATYFPSSSAATATVTTLASGQSRTADVRLHEGTVLSGQVLSPDGTVPPSARVTLDGPTLLTLETDADGRWSSRVVAGTWTVRAEASTGIPTSFGAPGTGTAVSASGSGSRAGLDVRLDRGHVLSGRIAVAGAALANATVAADDAAAGVQVVGPTGPDGRFALHVPDGTYVLSVHPDDPRLTSTWWPGTTDVDSATPLTISADRSGLDLALSDAGGTTMSGTVRTPDGAPAREVAVCLQHTASSQACMASTVTDDQGHWVAAGLTDGTYRIRLTSPSASFAPTFHPATTVMAQAASFAIAGGVAVSGLQSTLVTAAQINGTVQGAGDERIEVTAHPVGGGAVVSTRSRPDGTFTLAPLAAGSYRIGLNRVARETAFAASLHDGVLESAGNAGTTPITLTAGQVRSGVTLRPVMGGVLSGRVVTLTGAGVPGALVRAFTRDGSLSPRFTTTDGNGRFNLAGLDNGRYTVGLLAPLDPDTESYPYYYDAGSVATRTTTSLAASDPVTTRVGTTVRLEQNLVVDTAFDPVDGWGLDLIEPPSVTGTAQVGQVLTGDPGTWTTTPTSTVTTWFVDGRKVGTGRTYTLQAADLGGHVSMRADVESVSGDGDHIHGTAWSAQVGPVASAPPVTAPRKPSLRGTAKVGQKLTVDVGAWTPSGTSTQVAWLRNGIPVAGATGTGYTLTKADVGARISARVTGTFADHTPLTVTSPASAPVKAVSTTKVKATPGKQKVTLKITVTAPGLSAARTSGPVVVTVGSKKVKATVKNGTATVVVKKLKKGRRTVTVSYGGNASAVGSSKKVTVKVR